MTSSLALCNFILKIRFFCPNMSTLKIVQSLQHEFVGTSFWKPIRFLWLVEPLEGWRPVILVSMSNKGRWVVRRCLQNSIWSKFSVLVSIKGRWVVRRCLEKPVSDQSFQVAVIAPGDDMRILGSEDATTCHIVVLRWRVSRVTCNVYNFKRFSSYRDSNAGVTGLAHLDNDEPEDFLMLEREVWILDGGWLSTANTPVQ